MPQQRLCPPCLRRLLLEEEQLSHRFAQPRGFSLTLYLFLHPGTGQAKGFSSPPFMHMELRMASELMALSVVQDSSLSDSS